MKKVTRFSVGLLVAILVAVSFSNASVVRAATEECTAYTQTIVSGTSDQVVGGGSAVLTQTGSSWTTLAGAGWIWSSELVANPENQEVFSFSRTFLLPGAVASASIEIAADDYFKLFVNGTQIASEFGEGNFFSVHTYNLTSSLHSGTNTIVSEITNAPYFYPGEGTPYSNPAGLLYRLEVSGSDCGSSATPTPTPTPTQSRTGGTMSNIPTLTPTPISTSIPSNAPTPQTNTNGIGLAYTNSTPGNTGGQDGDVSPTPTPNSSDAMNAQAAAIGSFLDSDLCIKDATPWWWILLLLLVAFSVWFRRNQNHQVSPWQKRLSVILIVIAVLLAIWARSCGQGW